MPTTVDHSAKRLCETNGLDAVIEIKHKDGRSGFCVEVSDCQAPDMLSRRANSLARARRRSAGTWAVVYNRRGEKIATTSTYYL